jgi:hypothetical protein
MGLLISGALNGQVFAQDGFVAESTTLSYNVFDKNGKAFVNPAPDVAGSPFLTDAWKLGSLVINTNRRFDSVKVRLNIYSQEVHFLDKNNNEMALAKGYIRSVVLAGGLRFQDGFPPVDEQDANNFYQVLAEGKITLLLSIRKIIATQKDDMTGDVKKEYRTYQDYYLYDGKTMLRVKKDKALLAGKEIKFKNIDELKKAVDAYNAS